MNPFFLSFFFPFPPLFSSPRGKNTLQGSSSAGHPPPFFPPSPPRALFFKFLSSFSSFFPLFRFGDQTRCCLLKGPIHADGFSFSVERRVTFYPSLFFSSPPPRPPSPPQGRRMKERRPFFSPPFFFFFPSLSPLPHRTRVRERL